MSVLIKEVGVRITRQAQLETRTRILEAARQLFRTTGFEATTTRELAIAAGIATGTLFNYFPTKEAIVMTFVADALENGREDYASRRRAAQVSVSPARPSPACRSSSSARSR